MGDSPGHVTEGRGDAQWIEYSDAVCHEWVTGRCLPDVRRAVQQLSFICLRVSQAEMPSTQVPHPTMRDPSILAYLGML